MSKTAEDKRVKLLVGIINREDLSSINSLTLASMFGLDIFVFLLAVCLCCLFLT